MPDESPSIAEIRLIALDGERSYDALPAVRDVAIRVKVDELHSDDGADSRDGRRLTTVLATLFLEVFGADDEGEESVPSQAAAGSSGSEGIESRTPVYSSRVTFRVDAQRPAAEDPRWVPAVFAEAWPYLRSQVIAHALLLGMGRIPVPLEAPENLARQPHPVEG